MSNLVDLSSNLSSVYETIYESGKYSDISINVGEEPNKKIFLAHTLVLCARSKYLENEIMEFDEDQKAIIVLEDVTPDIFEVLIRFIYTGKVPSNLCEGIDWFRLLKAALKLKLDDLTAAIGDYLLNSNEKWVQDNILAVHNLALSTDSLQNLLGYCNRIMASLPSIILKSDNVPRVTMIRVLQNDELNMNESEIWMAVIQWAIKQVPGLVGNQRDWSSDDVNAIKDIIADCLPHIRFFNMSHVEFSEKVVPYDELLPRELRHAIVNFYAVPDYKPNVPMLPIRWGQLPDVDSVIIDKRQASWIVQKIVKATNQDLKTPWEQFTSHQLTLLYRRSRDGGLQKNFRQKCEKRGPTVTVGKVLVTDEILGGYNPVAWGSQGYGHVSTSESFIFALDKDNLENSIVSHVVEKNHAIWDGGERFPNFSTDLHFAHATSTEKCAYEIPIRPGLERSGFYWIDWEVFLVTKRVVD